MNTLSYKSYTAKIEFDPDDNILFGNIIGIRDTVGFHGESVSELKDAFHEAVDFYLESCHKASYHRDLFKAVHPAKYERLSRVIEKRNLPKKTCQVLILFYLLFLR